MTSYTLPLRSHARTSFARAALFIVTASLALSHSVLGQSHPVAVADIPFAFSSGSNVLPAGHYTFVMIAPHTYALKSNGETVYISVLEGDRPRKDDVSSIHFRQYGGSYFLDGAWFAADGMGIHLPKGGAEKKIEAANKKADQAGTVVAVNAVPNLK